MSFLRNFDPLYVPRSTYLNYRPTTYLSEPLAYPRAPLTPTVPIHQYLPAPFSLIPKCQKLNSNDTSLLQAK